MTCTPELARVKVAVVASIRMLLRGKLVTWDTCMVSLHHSCYCHQHGLISQLLKCGHVSAMFQQLVATILVNVRQFGNYRYCVQQCYTDITQHISIQPFHFNLYILIALGYVQTFYIYDSAKGNIGLNRPPFMSTTISSRVRPFTLWIVVELHTGYF